jgi:hypothetical protein
MVENNSIYNSTGKSPLLLSNKDNQSSSSFK